MFLVGIIILSLFGIVGLLGIVLSIYAYRNISPGPNLIQAWWILPLYVSLVLFLLCSGSVIYLIMFGRI